MGTTALSPGSIAGATYAAVGSLNCIALLLHAIDNMSAILLILHYVEILQMP